MCIRDRLWTLAEGAMTRHGLMGDRECGFRTELGPQRQVRDNSAWLDELSVVDFLKYMGAGARMGTMLGRDT